MEVEMAVVLLHHREVDASFLLQLLMPWLWSRLSVRTMNEKEKREKKDDNNIFVDDNVTEGNPDLIMQASEAKLPVPVPVGNLTLARGIVIGKILQSQCQYADRLYTGFHAISPFCSSTNYVAAIFFKTLGIWHLALPRNQFSHVKPLHQEKARPQL
jgi:hypothetical protein